MNLTTDTPISNMLELMAERIPSSSYIIRAVPAGNGKFNALYSAPGLIPEIAQSPDGRAYEYNTEQEAEWGAAKAMIGILNSSRRRARDHGKQERYRKLTGPELAQLIAKIGITPSFLAYIKGTTPERVLKWIDNVENVPHDIRVLLEIFVAFGKPAIDKAEEVTDAVTTERRPARQEQR